METEARELGPVATRVLFENDDVKVWEMDLQPGEICGLHRHTMDYVLYILEGAKLGVESPGQKPFSLDFGARCTYFIPAGGAESARNVGKTRFHEVLVEIKRAVRPGQEHSGYAASEALAGREPEPGALTILDNDRMRVTELTLAPGAQSERTVCAHDSVVYAAEGSRLGIASGDGKTRESDCPAGSVMWLPRGEKRTFVNAGRQRYRHVMVELK